MARGDLKSIIRYRKWELDEKQRALGELLRQEEGLLETLRQCDAEMSREMNAASDNMALFGITFSHYAHAAKARKEQIEEWLQQTRMRIEAARNALTDSFKEFKTLEITQANRVAAEKKEINDKQQKMMDDIGLNIHRRRQEEDGQA